MTRGNQRDTNRDRALKRAALRAPGKGNSTLKEKERNLSIVCNVCKQTFMCTVNRGLLEQHVDAKHPRLSFPACFPNCD